MENHNFTQPSTQSSPKQILGNPAAPFINSLMTAGNPNAAQTSWANHYFNTAPGRASVAAELPLAGGRHQ